MKCKNVRKGNHLARGSQDPAFGSPNENGAMQLHLDTRPRYPYP